MQKLFIAALVCSLSLLAVADDCKYTADDGTHFDLSALRDSSTDFTKKTDGGGGGVVFSYAFAVCKNVQKECQNIASPAAEFLTTPIGEGCRVLGSLAKQTWKLIDPSNPKRGVQIKYADGDPCDQSNKRSVTILIECNEQVSGLGEFKSVDGQGSCDYTYNFASPYGCPATSHHASGYFLLFFVLAALVYLAGGMIYRYKKLGLRGKETIPHLEFWSEVPSLVKDGVQYSISKTKQLVITVKDKIQNRNQYQAI